MKVYKNHNEFQNAMIERCNITIEENSKCWQRIHIHPTIRKICKWKRANSVNSTLTLLHEIGHCENNNSKMRRCEREYYATKWALDVCRIYGIEVPNKLIDKYQKYIYTELARGLRRGGKNYPTKEEMKLRKEE